MAVNFKTKKTGPALSDKSLNSLQSVVRKTFGLPEASEVHIGMTRTMISNSGLRIELPFGIAQVKNGSQKIQEARQSLLGLIGAQSPMEALPQHSPASVAAGGVPIPAMNQPVAADADMEDQVWVEHVAQNLFPGTLHLYQAEELYQPVLGTSGGSIYKTCFIGPELRVAARIKGNKVSFRATTNNDECPQGQVQEVFKRLGVTGVHNNRLTCHASMNGAFNAEHAHEYRALFGAFYAALKPWITSNFPAIGQLAIGVK